MSGGTGTHAAFFMRVRSFIRAAATAAKISNRSPSTTTRSGRNSLKASAKPVYLKPILLNLAISEVKFRRQAHVSSDDFQCQLRVVLDTLHDPAHQAVLGSSAGNNADFPHLFFFFIVCLNLKTAKFSSIEVSVSLVCKSSSKISEISSPLFCMSDFCWALS